MTTIRRAAVAVGLLGALLVWALAPDAARAAGPRVRLTPSKVSFGGIEPGHRSEPEVIGVSNTGDAPLLLGPIAHVGSADFHVTVDGCGGATVAPEHTCWITMRFAPRRIARVGPPSPGDLFRAGELRIPSNAPSGMVRVELFGDAGEIAGGTAPTPPPWGQFRIVRASVTTHGGFVRVFSTLPARVDMTILRAGEPVGRPVRRLVRAGFGDIAVRGRYTRGVRYAVRVRGRRPDALSRSAERTDARTITVGG
jgi:hypothetical protein